MEKKHLALHHKKLSEIKEYKKNSRVHPESQIKQICESIKEFGFNNPILIDEDSVIIAGHGRFMAAKVLGLDVAPCIVLDGLIDEQKKAYVIADNKIHENGEWNEEILKEEIESISKSVNVDLLGFSEKEMSKIFDETAGIKIESDLDEKNLDQVIVKFMPCDRNDVINIISDALKDYKDAYVWCEDE